MIVADVNVLAYLLIEGPQTDTAKRVLQRDDRWIAPPLWRYEFLNVLATSVRAGHMTQIKANELWNASLKLVDHAAGEVSRAVVLGLSVESRIAVYDCEYVALARAHRLRLVTADRKVLNTFPDVAIGLDEFADGKSF